MGFVKDLVGAAYGSYEGALADSWLESITCDEYASGQLMAKGHPLHSGRSSNTSAEANVITDGSKIFVGPQETALVIENGKITNVLSQQGEHIFHSEYSKGFFSEGSLGEKLHNVTEDAKERFAFAGVKAVVQLVLYINQKEISGNEFATDWIPVRVHIPDINYDVDCSCRLAGMYSFKIVDAVAFYKNFTGNNEGGYYADSLSGLIKSLLLTGVQTAIPKLFSEGTRPAAMVGYAEALGRAICEETTKALGPQRGLALVKCGISSFTLQGKDLRYLKEFEKDKVLLDPVMRAAHLTGARAEALQTIAYKADTGIAGFAIIGAALEKKRAEEGIVPQKPKLELWQCKCGRYSQGKFCSNCGQARLYECRECGALTTGRFCPHCGTKLRD